MEPAWFTKAEYQGEKKCICSCGQTYNSQAREIQFVEKRPEKHKDGSIKRNEHGRELIEKVAYNGCLSLKPCPKCQNNRPKSFS